MRLFYCARQLIVVCNMIIQCCAVSMLRSADVCNAAYLREACVSYIVDHFKAVVLTEECVVTSLCSAREKPQQFFC